MNSMGVTHGQMKPLAPVQDGETFPLELTHDCDEEGNWIKRYEEEEPTLTREITYW